MADSVTVLRTQSGRRGLAIARRRILCEGAMNQVSHFPRYDTRTVHRLDGLWEATFVGADVDPGEVRPGDIRWDDLMTVPGVFDSCPNHVRKRGCFALRHFVDTVDSAARGRLRFGGLGLWGRVFVDGECLGTCQTPYAPWSVAVPPGRRRQRELVILIDNRFDRDRVPLFDPFFDFYGYGGIYRSVAWHELPACALDRVTVTPLDLAGNVRIDIRLDGNAPAKLDATLAFDGGDPAAFNGLELNSGLATLTTRVPSPRLWEPANPRLHTLRVGIDGDSITERFGLRTVTAERGKILLNGKPVKLLGYNRHEAHPQFGPALPPQQLLHDLQLLRRLGCNFVRGSHYPQDQRFLDLCDELGFLVFEEALGWGTPAVHLADPRFNELQEAQTRAMVRASANHPSVILWGFLNECESHKPESDAAVARLAGAIREEDPSRLVTFATNHPFEERNYDKVDVVSVNQYPGWYPEDRHKERPLDEIEPLIDRVIAHLKAEGQAAKPFIISEMGAGAIYGWRDELEAHWSEQYQAAYLGILARRVVADERIAGVAIWQFCDGRTYAHGHALGRPRAFNNKGSFDEYRRPKMAADTVRRIFTGEA